MKSNFLMELNDYVSELGQYMAAHGALPPIPDSGIEPNSVHE